MYRTAKGPAHADHYVGVNKNSDIASYSQLSQKTARRSVSRRKMFVAAMVQLEKNYEGRKYGRL